MMIGTQTTKQVGWISGVGNISLYKFDGVGFTNDGTPVLITKTFKKVPISVRRKCAGKKIRILEINTKTDWVTVY